MRFRSLNPSFLSLFLLSCASDEASQAAQAQGLECDADNGGITLPEGFCAIVVADDLGRARHLAVTGDSDVYVAMQEGRNGVVALRDADGDGRAEAKEEFGNHFGTGIDVWNGYLYFGTNASVLRYRLTPGRLVPEGDDEVVVEGFPQQRSHAAKPIAFDDQGNLYVNVGAPSNACQEQDRTPGSPGLDPCPLLEWQASIWRFEAGRTGQTQREHGYRLSKGIRHAVALDWDPISKSVYVVQHGRDQLDTLWPERFDARANADNPAEEFFKLEDGADFLWPYCYFDPNQGKRVLAPEYGGDGAEAGDCGRAPAPLVAFPAHWAPNDLLFYDGALFPERYRGGAFIAFHGSWNREPFPQTGYHVVFVPMKNGRPEGDWEVFADGFTGREPLSSPRDARFRPMGLAQGPDGSLYVSDSVRGRIWRVIHRGSESS